MRIIVLGSGYVGLVSGTCFAEFGFDVVCIDIEQAKIAKLQQGTLPIYEPGLAELFQKNCLAGRLSFTTDLITNIPTADLIFVAIGTPSADNGTVDLSYIFSAAHTIAPQLHKYTPIIIKSTVPPGTCRALKQEILKTNPAAKFDVISNPEFLREGVAVQDFMRPDRIVVGLDNAENRTIMTEIYQPLIAQQAPIVFTSLESAELIKYASNAFLATKIAFINEMADICEKIDADVQVVAQGMGMDQRIGQQFLQAGPGYGGSCFPKDTLGLQAFAQEIGAPTKIVDAVIAANSNRTAICVQRVISVCGGSVVNKEIAVLGVAFKANTDDIRASPAVEIIQALITAGTKVRLFDPQALENAKQHFQSWHNIAYADNIVECIRGAQALLILTEWKEFRNLNLAEVERLLLPAAENAPKLFIDLRNLYSAKDFNEVNMQYVSVGRSTLHPVAINERAVLHE